MKENTDLYYIAALVDGEIKDPSEDQKLQEAIRKDPDLEFEYFVQSFVKNLVSERLKISPAPLKVRKHLYRKLSPAAGSRLLFTLLPDLYIRKPMIAWGSTVAVILALLLLLINRPPNPEHKNFAQEQIGSTNMYIQAIHNFENILAGKLVPQITTTSADKIKEFFTDQGVAYPTYVPEITGWNLIGAVVSVDRGEKFAQHIYSTADGRLVYLFQVDETEIKKKDFLSLTDDLIAYLNSGNCYTSTEGSLVTFLTKVKGNIFAVVSNGSLKEIENYFCQLN
jgi:hypothetical protein